VSCGGSVLTDPPVHTTHSRMTNGSVSRSPVSHSTHDERHGTKRSSTALVVSYQDGSKTISCLKCPMVEVAPEKVTLAAATSV